MPISNRQSENFITAFLKSWNSKFKKKRVQSNIVGDGNNSEDIVQEFKKFFSQTCVPNNTSIHMDHKHSFLKEFNNYSFYENSQNLFTIDNITAALCKLKKGRAAGQDNISVEHLTYAHPCLVVSLKLLFNLMLSHGFVPDDFGRGIIIALLKDSNADSSLCDNYRGITLNCVLSKLFEYAVLEKYSYLFKTDDLQFGFKNGVDCYSSDALYNVNSVINHYVKNGCICLCS